MFPLLASHRKTVTCSRLSRTEKNLLRSSRINVLPCMLREITATLALRDARYERGKKRTLAVRHVTQYRFMVFCVSRNQRLLLFVYLLRQYITSLFRLANQSEAFAIYSIPFCDFTCLILACLP